jgi:hypothetical protein
MRYDVEISRHYNLPQHTLSLATLGTFREESYGPVARHRSGQVMRQLAMVHICV